MSDSIIRFPCIMACRCPATVCDWFIFFLIVHLLDMASVSDVLDRHTFFGCNDELLDVSNMVECLMCLFEHETVERGLQSVSVDVGLCVDLVLNWILNLFDMSVMILSRPAFVMLCVCCSFCEELPEHYVHVGHIEIIRTVGCCVCISSLPNNHL